MGISFGNIAGSYYKSAAQRRPDGKQSIAYPTDRRILEQEVKVETYRARGPGGQHRNVTNSAVRLTHLPSGVVVVAADSRSQHRNKEKAFERLSQRLQRLNQVKPKRIPTRQPAAVKERTLQEKRKRKQVKEHRSSKRSRADIFDL